MTKKRVYQIELFYGFEEGECDIWHSFEACDPDSHPDEDEMERRLAEILEVSPNSFSFHYDSIYIDLPESVVNQIRTDAVREYIENRDQ